eukprot:CAMPEP_0181197994 /NCGR_PEP_ID=MMETSP1096-20121128/16359_1 /TAXON_ID=156174 ORGANISM="Chrysochromulina ericina, Strain CCMP281" /NCGR_SAMPLE_ID=MMETSP1096 /ASSEMBLY_ACC=CAM_ASM_000453 /LENGTH=119 /DNA_ID=CAMNT_0023287985 /DNA_START=73 /DNA_END=432 /DNA_ORIENTATION=-
MSARRGSPMSVRRGSLSTASAEFKKLFDSADVDQDGSLNLSEFGVALKSMPEAGSLTDAEAEEVFLEVDADKDGLVSWPEFKAVFDDEDDDEEEQPARLSAVVEAEAAANAAAFESDED